jgi:hypothetical protein
LSAGEIATSVHKTRRRLDLDILVATLTLKYIDQSLTYATLKESLEQRNTPEREQGLYPRARAHFEMAKLSLQENLGANNTKRNTEDIQKVEGILAALSHGDVQPAQELLLSQIEANARAMRTERELREAGVDIEKEHSKRGIHTDTEPYGSRIARIAEMLEELERPDLSEAKQQGEAAGMEQNETATLERVVAELGASEARLRQIINEVQSEKKRIEALIRQAALEKIRRSM